MYMCMCNTLYWIFCDIPYNIPVYCERDAIVEETLAKRAAATLCCFSLNDTLLNRMQSLSSFYILCVSEAARSAPPQHQR